MGLCMRVTPFTPSRFFCFALVKFLFKAVRLTLCPSLATKVNRGDTPNPNFLWKTAKKSFLVLVPMAKDCTAACIKFSVLGTKCVTGHSAFEDQP